MLFYFPKDLSMFGHSQFGFMAPPRQSVLDQFSKTTDDEIQKINKKIIINLASFKLLVELATKHLPAPLLNIVLGYAGTELSENVILSQKSEELRKQMALVQEAHVMPIHKKYSWWR